MEFDELVGQECDFYGVDTNQFKLDDTVWEAVEDESDGYRSMLDVVEQRADIGLFFHAPIARVRVEHIPDERPGEYSDIDDVYYLRDVTDGHVWLRFGTTSVDDYYPAFTFSYQAKQPEKPS